VAERKGEPMDLIERQAAIETEPEEDVKPVVHAHWILDPNGMDFGLPAWRCSNCRRKNTMIPTFVATKHGGFVPKNPNIFEGSNYCPNCGAKMDEVTLP